MAELLLRFLLGGAIVSAFAIAGELFEPKTFGGLMAAAPSLAMVTLALAFAHEGSGYVMIESRSMVLGAVAFFVYCATCTVAIRRPGIPVWLPALGGWGLWVAVALGLWKAAEALGLLV